MAKKKPKAPPKPLSGTALMRASGARRVECWFSEDEYASVEAVCELVALKVARFVCNAALDEARKIELRHALDAHAAQVEQEKRAAE